MLFDYMLMHQIIKVIFLSHLDSFSYNTLLTSCNIFDTFYLNKAEYYIQFFSKNVIVTVIIRHILL